MEKNIKRVEFTQEMTPEIKVLKAWYSFLKKEIEKYGIAKFIGDDASCIYYDEHGKSYNARLVIVCNIQNYFSLDKDFKSLEKIEIIKALDGGELKRGYIVYVGAQLRFLHQAHNYFPQLKKILWQQENLKLQSIVKV